MLERVAEAARRLEEELGKAIVAAMLQMVAAITGGVTVDAADTGPLERHLRSLSRPQSQPVHPMRSAWWSVPFVAALCAEWAVPRKRGAR